MRRPDGWLRGDVRRPGGGARHGCVGLSDGVYTTTAIGSGGNTINSPQPADCLLSPSVGADRAGH